MSNLLFRLFLVTSESLNFCLLYLYAISGLGVAGFMNPWSFLTIGPSLTALNLAMRRTRFRYITIAFANIVVFAATLSMGKNPEALFSFPDNSPAILGFLATWLILLIAGGRGVFLSWTKNPPRFGLFDINMAFLFLILVLSSSFGIHLPEVHSIIFLAILSNLLMLFFGSRSECSGQASRRAFLALAALLVPIWLIGHSEALSVLGQPAETAIRFSKPFFELLLQGLSTVLLVIFRFTKLVPHRQAPADSGGNLVVGEENLMPPGKTGFFVQCLFVAMAVFVVILATLLTLYLLWLIVRFLLHKRTNPASGDIWSRPSFRAFLATLYRALKRMALMATIFLPLPITAERAYSFLLFWGKHRGNPRNADETAYEYLARLLERFPERERELTRITGSFVRHRYSREGKVFEQGLKWYVLKLYLRAPFGGG